MDKLEKEIVSIDQLEESNVNQIVTKIQSYQQFIEKKSKLLPDNSSIILNVGASLSILMGKVKNDMKMLTMREKMTRKRLNILEIVDKGNRSRLKGFELFRLYQILEQKLELDTSNSQEREALTRQIQSSLLESHLLLKDDIETPLALHKCYQKLLSSVDPDTIASIVDNINVKHN